MTVSAPGDALAAPDRPHAWPFLIGRARHAGHRVLVVPDFMADRAAVSALAAAARTADLPDGTARLRELRGLANGPICLVYRSPTARAGDYRLPGDGRLLDETGRNIRLAEGLVLRLPASAVEAIGIDRADLERVHATVAPAYRLFWEREDGFTRQTSRGLELSTPVGRGGEPIRLQRDAPWVAKSDSGMPVHPRPRQPETVAGYGPGRQESGRDQWPETQRPETQWPEMTVARPRRKRLLFAAGAAVAAVIVLTVVLVGHSRAPVTPHALPDAALTGFCDAVNQGSAVHAYGFLSAAYRQQMSKAVFNAQFFPAAGKDESKVACTFTAPAMSGNAADSTIFVVSPGHSRSTWSAHLTEESGTWYIGSMARNAGGR